MSNFKYCPSIWIFCGNETNNKINKINICALRVCLIAMMCLLLDLLLRSNKHAVHGQNLQRLFIEIYKTLHLLSPPFLFECCQRKKIRYNLRTSDSLATSTSTMTFGMYFLLQLTTVNGRGIAEGYTLNRHCYIGLEGIEGQCDTCRTMRPITRS